MRSRFLGAARRTIARACAHLGPRSRGLRVLTYHRVNDRHPHDRLSVRPEAFAAQMGELAESGRPVMALPQALPALLGKAPFTDGAVALTFDDGFEDNFSVALPILDRFGFPATFFVVSRYVGSARTLDRYGQCCDFDRLLDWDQVRGLRERGHTVGGHGSTHRELASLAPADVRAEAEGCARDIEAATGERPRLFCYPRGSEGPGVRRIVAEAGFQAACTVRPGANPPGSDLFALRRTEISGEDTLEDFRLKLHGGFDAWHRALQSVRGLRP